MINTHIARRIKITLILILIVIFSGILGYVSLEHYTFLDAFYMTIITISTVGFKEIYPLSTAGKLFTSFLIIISFGTFAYAISTITTYILEGEFNKYLKGMKLNKSISKINEHVIICGYGRNGQQAAQELKNHNTPFIVIERNHEIVEKNNDEILIIEADATRDEILDKAGITRAKALISTLPKDSDNLFIVLTARGKNKKLKIISRASDDNSLSKLKIAGADNVIMPDKIGGAHMASLVIKPDVVEFLNHIIGQSTGSIQLEEVTFELLPDEYKNKSIKELAIRNKSGANIVGFKTPDGEYIINPSPDTIIQAKTKIFVLGRKKQIDKFKSMFLSKQECPQQDIKDKNEKKNINNRS